MGKIDEIISKLKKQFSFGKKKSDEYEDDILEEGDELVSSSYDDSFDDDATDPQMVLPDELSESTKANLIDLVKSKNFKLIKNEIQQHGTSLFKFSKKKKEKNQSDDDSQLDPKAASKERIKLYLKVIAAAGVIFVFLSEEETKTENAEVLQPKKKVEKVIEPELEEEIREELGEPEPVMDEEDFALEEEVVFEDVEEESPETIVEVEQEPVEESAVSFNDENFDNSFFDEKSSETSNSNESSNNLNALQEIGKQVEQQEIELVNQEAQEEDNLQKKIEAKEKYSSIYVAYEVPGRGLIYNCKKKHWACVDRSEYMKCKELDELSTSFDLPKKCVIKDVFLSDGDCSNMQQQKIDQVEVPDNCL